MRGGALPHVSLEDAAVVGAGRSTELVALDDAPYALARLDPRVQVVEMRFFAGLSVEETAADSYARASVTPARYWAATVVRLAARESVIRGLLSATC